MTRPVLLEESFKKLYQQHFEALCRFAHFYCSDAQLAKDTVQHVFLSLWEGKKDVSEMENPSAYLYTSVKNKILNEQRKTQITKTLEQEDVAISNTAQEELEESEMADRLSYWINQLPEKRQYIFRLSREEQKSYKEIAQLMDIAPKTVENQIGKALKFLKSKIFDTENQ